MIVAREILIDGGEGEDAGENIFHAGGPGDSFNLDRVEGEEQCADERGADGEFEAAMEDGEDEESGGDVQQEVGGVEEPGVEGCAGFIGDVRLCDVGEEPPGGVGDGDVQADVGIPPVIR